MFSAVFRFLRFDQNIDADLNLIRPCTSTTKQPHHCAIPFLPLSVDLWGRMRFSGQFLAIVFKGGLWESDFVEEQRCENFLEMLVMGEEKATGESRKQWSHSV